MDALRWEIEADALTLIHRGLAECGKTAHREIAQGEIQKWLAPGGDGVVQALALNAGVDFLAREHAPLGAGGFRFRLVQFQCRHGHACSHFSSLSYARPRYEVGHLCYNGLIGRARALVYRSFPDG